MYKTEEESKHLTLELRDKAVEFLPGDLKKHQGGIIRPTETDECLAKPENMEVARNNGAETKNTSVSGGNHEIYKGESFLISPEISKVANETCVMSENSEVDETTFRAEKIPEDEEKMGIDKKFQLADNVVRPVDCTITCEKDKEIPQEADGMQDKVSNAVSEHQMMMTSREIPLKEISGDDVKEHSTMPSEEYDPTLVEERKITDETSEKDQAPYKHSETPVSQATDDLLMQKEDNPTLEVPKAEFEDTGKKSGHKVKEQLAEEPNVYPEQVSGKCSSVSVVNNVSNGEEPREIETLSEAFKAKTLQGEQSSDLGLETEKIEDGKPLDGATDLGETASTCKDDEKANQEEENLAKNSAKQECLKEDTEIGKVETELPRGAHDQILEVVNVNDDAKVDNEVDKADDSEDIKEHAMEEESSPNELHPVSKGDETIKEVEDYSSVSTECLKEADSKEQIKEKKSEVDEHSTKDREASPVVEESEKRRQDGESGEPLSVQGEHRESEEKIEDILNESKHCQDESDIEAVTNLKEETRLNDDLVNTLNISSVKSQETTESDANQETKEVRLEEVSSDLASPVEKIEEEIQKDGGVKHESLEDSSDSKRTEEVCLQKEELRMPKAVSEEETIVDQGLQKGEPEEPIQTASSALPSEEREHETGTTSEEIDVVTGDEIIGEQTLSANKPEEGTTSVTLLSKEHEGENISTVDKIEEEKVKEAETLEDEIRPQSECSRELQGAIEYGAATQTLPGEKQADELHITASILPSEVQEDETKETELQEDESPEKIPEYTREIEVASNVKMETSEKAFDNESLTESEDTAIKGKLVKARDETGDEENQCKKTNKGNEIILNEVSKEEVMEDKEVTETSYSTPHSEQLAIGRSREDELKDKLIEDERNEALKTTSQTEEIVVEAQKPNENEIMEKHIIFEDKTVEDPGQASVAWIETATASEEESSKELSRAEGTKDFAEGNVIINDIQQPEEPTNIASDKQIPREFNPVENTEISRAIGNEHVLVELHDRVADSSQKAEVRDAKEIYPKVVEHAGEKTMDNSGEEITEKSTSVEDSSKVSSSEHVESSTKETLQVAQNMKEEREAEYETGAAQILLVEKPEEQSPAPSSKLPTEEEHGVTTKVDAVEEKELKAVEILEKDSSDTKTGEVMCLEKEENKELKAVVEQETIAVQTPPTGIKEDSVSHFEDGRKEDELKDEHTGDKTNETLKVPTYKIQNDALSLETLNDGANNNIEKEIVAEDKTVKDLEQASVGMKEATSVREEIPGEADPIESRTSTIGKPNFPIEKQDRALEKPELGDFEPGKVQEICTEAGVDHGEEKRTDNSGVEITQEPASVDSGKLSLSDLLQRSTRENMQIAERVIEERELTVSKEEPHVEEAGTIQVKEAKTDEGEEGDEHNKKDYGSDALVMVEVPRDFDTKPHKKSHNILSGVGSKVKHSISKVKRAITGKSSHSKESKSISPKGC